MYDWVPPLAGPVQLLMEDMLYAQVDWERVRACPAEARENLVQFVRRLMQLELDLLRNGLEAIPPFYDTLTDPVERLAIAMVNNSFDWVRIWVVFQNFISAKDVPSDKYLEYVIFSRYLFEAWVKRYRLGDYYDSMEKLEGTLLSYLGPEYACRPPFEEFYTLLKKRRAFEERQEAREKTNKKIKGTWREEKKDPWDDIFAMKEPLSEAAYYANVDWKRIRRCPLEARQELLPFIDRLVRMRARFLLKGPEVTARFPSLFTDPVERLGMTMAVSPRAPDASTIYTRIHNLISAENLPDQKYLEYVIFTRFVLELITNEWNLFNAATVLEPTLVSYLGPDFVRPFNNVDDFSSPYGQEILSEIDNEWMF